MGLTEAHPGSGNEQTCVTASTLRTDGGICGTGRDSWMAAMNGGPRNTALHPALIAMGCIMVRSVPVEHLSPVRRLYPRRALRGKFHRGNADKVVET